MQYSATAASASACTVALDGTVTFTAAGRCTIVATQAGNANDAAGRSTQVVVVHAHEGAWHREPGTALPLSLFGAAGTVRLTVFPA